MALSKAARDLRDVVTCAVCFDIFTDKDPRSLPCLHTFCVKCLDEVYTTKTGLDPGMGGYINCPTCTERTKLPQGSVYHLRRYFIAQQVTDVVKDLSRADAQDGSFVHSCGRCWKNREIASYCFDCSIPMCEICLEKHKQRKTTNSHNCITVNRSEITSLICVDHQEFAEDFCVQCQCIVCNTCHTTTHNKHEFQEICFTNDEAKEAFRHYLKSNALNSNILAQLDELEAGCLAKNDEDEELVLKVSELKKNVEQQRNASAMMQNQAQPIFVSSKHEASSDTSDTSDQEDTADGDIDPVAKEYAWSQVWVKQVNIQSMDFLPGGDSMAVVGGQLRIYDQKGCSKPIPVSLTGLGDLLHITVNKASSEIAAVFKGYNQFCIHLFSMDVPVWTTNVITFQAKSVFSVVYASDASVLILHKITDPHYISSYTTAGVYQWRRCMNHECKSMAVTANGNIITSGGTSYQLHVYNSEGNELYELPYDEDKDKLASPQGVCTDDQDNIYVCDWYKVVMFNKEGIFMKNIDLHHPIKDPTTSSQPIKPLRISVHEHTMLVATCGQLSMFHLSAKSTNITTVLPRSMSVPAAVVPRSMSVPAAVVSSSISVPATVVPSSISVPVSVPVLVPAPARPIRIPMYLFYLSVLVGLLAMLYFRQYNI